MDRRCRRVSARLRFPAPLNDLLIGLHCCGAPALLSRLSSVEDPFGGIGMAKLIYIANASVDGYTEDRKGGFNWGDPDEEYFGSVNGLQRPVGTYLYGRRMYETMVYWETAPLADQPAWVAEFTDLWRAAEKVVFSRTLASVSSDRTTLERTFDGEAIRKTKAGGTGEITVGGADLAAQAFAAGLVDECHLYLWPISVGGGKPALPDATRLDLHLLGAERFRSGIVHLHYRVDS
jgi:dihydrofolate reductase